MSSVCGPAMPGSRVACSWFSSSGSVSSGSIPEVEPHVEA